MSRWCLVLHESVDMAATVAGMLRRANVGEPILAHNIAAARNALMERGRTHCQLVVSSFSPPSSADASPPLDRNRSSAIDFLREMRGVASNTPPWIFIVSYADAARVEELNALPAVARHLPGELWEHLSATAERLIEAKSGQPLHKVDVDITLGLGGTCKWKLTGTPGHAVDEAGMIDINDGDLQRLLAYSDGATKGSAIMLRQLSVELYEQLLANNLRSGLELALRDHLPRPFVLEAARIRFNIDGETSRLLVEALAKPKSRQHSEDLDMWMLRAPIVRKFGSKGDRYPLFKDRTSRHSPLNCLIVQGEHLRFSVGGALDKNFEPIPQAPAEVNWLAGYLERNREAFGLAPPCVLRRADHPASDYGDVVRRALKQGMWQLIHYVGHSATAKDGKGYLALGAGARDLIGIDEFADSAKHAQFVFLNSCQSADAGFIAKLVEESIPAVAGYAWSIDDAVAGRFCRHFYENLFEGEQSRRFLEYSFMRAKARLYSEHGEKPVWAAPLLFMQTLEHERD